MGVTLIGSADALTTSNLPPTPSPPMNVVMPTQRMGGASADDKESGIEATIPPAKGITYAIGLAAKQLWGMSV